MKKSLDGNEVIVHQPQKLKTESSSNRHYSPSIRNQVGPYPLTRNVTRSLPFCVDFLIFKIDITLNKEARVSRHRACPFQSEVIRKSCCTGLLQVFSSDNGMFFNFIHRFAGLWTEAAYSPNGERSCL